MCAQQVPPTLDATWKLPGCSHTFARNAWNTSDLSVPRKVMPKVSDEVARPRASRLSGVGAERYRLIRAAFQHAQKATIDDHYLEVISIQESIICDRLGSLVHGSLGANVTLRLTVSGLIRLAEKNVVVPRMANEGNSRSRRRRLPDDVLHFLSTHLRPWWQQRNDAVHGMAKLRRKDDQTFVERYGALEDVALSGFRMILEVDRFDQRERKQNGAGHSATWPDALALERQLESRLDRSFTTGRRAANPGAVRQTVVALG
jgi:hypothetical protein